MATSFRLEADFLERLSGVPVETCGLAVVTTSCREVPQCDPRLGPVADRRQLLCSRISRPEALFRLVKLSALQQRSSQYELRRTDLVEVVLPTLQKLERIPRQTLRLVVLAPVQMNPGDPLERLRGVRRGIGVERPRVGRLDDDLGFEGTSSVLNDRLKARDIAGMAATITDEMLEHFAVVAPWDELADRLVERYGGIASRLVMYTAEASIRPTRPRSAAGARSRGP